MNEDEKRAYYAALEIKKREFSWDLLGQDDGMLPLHLPMGVDSQGRGPVEPAQPHHYECWCGWPACPLTLALKQGWRAGAREMAARKNHRIKIHVPPREHPDSGKEIL